VDKSNFLAVYAEAHKKTLTPKNICSALWVTGVIPFNPNVITAEAMAPSLMMSTRDTVPMQQSSPIRLMSEMIVDYMDYQVMSAKTDQNDGGNIPEPSTTPLFAHSPVDGLSLTSTAFLTSASLIITTCIQNIHNLTLLAVSVHRFACETHRHSP
jgi:hypothetical protein